jgi:hypothetical protein
LANVGKAMNELHLRQGKSVEKESVDRINR